MSLFKKLFGKKEAEEYRKNEEPQGIYEPSEEMTEGEGLLPQAVEEAEEEAKESTCTGEEVKQEGFEKKEEKSKALVQEQSLEEEQQEEEASIQEQEVTQGMIPEDEEKQKMPKQGFIKKLFSGLTKTRDTLLKGVDEVLGAFKHIDEELYEELEEALIMADFGVDTTLRIMEDLRAYVKNHKITEPTALREALQQIITEMIMAQPEDLMAQEGPTVVLVIGVNGVGKTTSIGKLAHLLKQKDKKVLLAAADTFRAAAINQLQIWADRAGVALIKHEEGSDAAAVVFDAIAAAKSRKSDVLICDTAGRLQNKVNLMKELEKISRIIEKEYPEAKKEILIVLDATTGQNAWQQVKLFKEVADISGIILTKLDGTAKGGAIVGIYSTLQVPVKYIGVGEKIDDLQPFDPQDFAKALFENQ